MKKIFVVLIGILMFFYFDCYEKEIDNLKKDLYECKKSLENNNIY